MAGEGQRFAVAGYKLPKPLIDVNGKPMARAAFDSLNVKGNYIYVIRREHNKGGRLVNLLKEMTPKCTVVEIDELTEGAACSVLMAEEYIDNRDPLLIANCDQVIEWDSTNFIE